jgi:hypothetical protein
VSVSLDIQLEAPPNSEPHYRPGDWVRGLVSVLGGGNSRALKISLHFREHTTVYTATVRTEGGAPVHYGPLAAGQSFDFAIQLPADALPSFTSAHGELYWEIEVKSDEPGFDTTLERRIDVTTA